MKLRMIGATALVAMAGTLPAMAQVYTAPPPDAAPVIVDSTVVVPVERIYVPALRNGSPIHGGWVAPGDDLLLGNTITALESARGMEGMTITIVAKNGELILNGVASPQQAAQIERIAKNVSGGRVHSQFTTQLG